MVFGRILHRESVCCACQRRKVTVSAGAPRAAPLGTSWICTRLVVVMSTLRWSTKANALTIKIPELEEARLKKTKIKLNLD